MSIKPIADNDSLAAFCEAQMDAEYVTIDTEFVREKTYYPIVCLIQVAGPEDAAVIDPLAAGIDLAPLSRLLSNEAVLKVFHAGRQDIEIFYQLFGAVPQPVFDSQIAAMVCGFGDQVAYGTLIQKLVGVTLEKTSRFADWSRPGNRWCLVARPCVTGSIAIWLTKPSGLARGSGRSEGCAT